MTSYPQSATPKDDVQQYKRLLGYLKPYKGKFSLVILSMVVLALAEPALAALVKPLLDGSFVDQDPFYIRYVPLAIFAVMLVRAIGMFAVNVGMGWIAEKVSTDLRNEVFAKIVMLPASYFEEHSTGNIIARLIYHIDNMKLTATQTLVPLVKDSITVLALLAWMIYLNWKLSIIIFVVAPLIALVISRVSRRLRHLSHEIQEAVGNMLHTVDESIRNQKAVKIFLAQEHEKQRASRIFNRVRQMTFKFSVASGTNAALIHMLSAVALASVVYFSALQSLEGEVSVGGFVSFFGAMALMLSPIKRLAGINENLQKGLAAAENVFGVLDLENEPAGGGKSIERPRGTLEFRNVSFSYPGHDEQVLKNISFCAGPNETVAIVGLSGSGKSTIAALIPLLHQPSEGQILLDGEDSRELAIDNLREQVAYVSQEILLFNDTIRHNIAYGARSDTSDSKLRQAADAAYATEFIDQLPDGFETQVGQGGQRLSGGQRQRIAIARAILKDSPIMIFDEATSALDTESERKVQKAIQELGRSKTLIVIAHRLSTIESADRILVIDNGRVVEQGSHAELLAQKGVYTRLHSLISTQEHAGVGNDRQTSATHDL